MMRNMLNAMRQQADMAGQSRAGVRQGVVSAYDGRYSVKVRIMPEDRETGWLPVSSPWIGNGWGLFAPPSVGDAVEVQFQEDDAEAGYVSGRFFNDSDQALKVPAGEFWLVHKSGSFLKFMNDGSVQLNTAGDLVGNVGRDATLTVAGNITSKATQWTHTGPVTINGLLTGTQGFSFSGTPPSGGPTGYITGAITYQNVAITATGGSQVWNGKHIDDQLRVTGIYSGNQTSGTPA